MTANELTKYVIAYMEKEGFTVWRNNAGKVSHNVSMAPAGVPDIIGYGPGGRFVGIEIKVGRDSLRPSQITWLGEARARGCFVGVVHDEIEAERAVLSYKQGDILW